MDEEVECGGYGTKAVLNVPAGEKGDTVNLPVLFILPPLPPILSPSFSPSLHSLPLFPSTPSFSLFLHSLLLSLPPLPPFLSPFTPSLSLSLHSLLLSFPPLPPWLRELANVFQTHALLKETSSGRVLFELDESGCHKYGNLLTGENVDLARDLSLNLLFPWSNKSKYINKLHLDFLDVVELVMVVYKSIQHARLSNYSMFRGNFLECVCALFVANFTQTFPLRKRIIQHGGLNYCISTFLISSPDYVSHCDAIEVSLYAICK